MQPKARDDILDRLIALADTREPMLAEEEFHIPVESYTSPRRFEEERELLFRQTPYIIGHESELKAPGDFLTQDAMGLPIMVVRDGQGALRGFLNVCRHRGTRLVAGPCGEGKKAFVCPYHNWTYELSGALRHLPQPQGFPGVDRERYGLVPVPVEARHGFLWLLPLPRGSLDVAAFLGPLDAELPGFGFDRHLLYRRVVQKRRTNWKLIMDAFLESYHIARLHRASIYPYFLDNIAILDAFPPHLRAAVARKELLESLGTPRETWDFRSCVSLAYFLFPGTIFVVHPDYLSVLVLIPEGPDTTLYTHLMFVPAEDGPKSDKAQQHWERSFQLIENHVFQKEDLATAESIHAGLASGANQFLTAGRYEHGLRLFHENLLRMLQAARG